MQTTPKLYPFQAIDLTLIDTYVRLPKAAMEKQENGPGYTVVYDGKVLGCFGVVIPWTGFGMAWSVPTVELFKKWPIWTTRTVRLTLRTIIKSFDLYRVELVAAGENAERWAELLGFSPEGPYAHNYGARGINVKRYELING